MAIQVADNDSTFALKVRLCRALAAMAPHAGFTVPEHGHHLPVIQFRNVSPMFLLLHHTLDLNFSINWVHLIQSPAGQIQYAWIDLADFFQGCQPL